MIIGSVSENREVEKRIAITPEISKKYKSLGLDICIVKNYATHLGFNDEDYLKEGVEILNSDKDVISKSNLILQLNILDDDKLNLLKQDQSLIGGLNTYLNGEKLKV